MGWSIVFSAVALVVWLLSVILRKLRGPQAVAEPQERTIDGKTVPDKLALAALVVPVESAGIYDVLRGLPDYGKTLLKLPAGQFDYIPPAPEPPPETPKEAPAAKRPAAKRVPAWTAARVAVMIWLRTVPRRTLWVAGAAAVLLVMGGLTLRQYQSQAAERERRGKVAAFFNGLDSTPAVKADGPSEPAPKADNPPAQAPAQQSDLLQALDAQMAEAKAHIEAAQRAQPSSGTDTVQAAGVLWTATDNGRDVNWKQADEYCSGLTLGGRRWRLPTSQELSGAWTETREPSSRNPGYIGLGHGFRLSESAAPMLWSGDGGGSLAKALYAFSEAGLRPEANIGTFRASTKRDRDSGASLTYTFRALCVSQ